MGLPESQKEWEELGVFYDPVECMVMSKGLYSIPGCPDPVSADGVRFSTPFIEYGPEDLDFLLYAGIVTEHRSTLFYIRNCQAIWVSKNGCAKKLEMI